MDLSFFKLLFPLIVCVFLFIMSYLSNLRESIFQIQLNKYIKAALLFQKPEKPTANIFSVALRVVTYFSVGFLLSYHLFFSNEFTKLQIFKAYRLFFIQMLAFFLLSELFDYISVKKHKFKINETVVVHKREIGYVYIAIQNCFYKPFYDGVKFDSDKKFLIIELSLYDAFFPQRSALPFFDKALSEKDCIYSDCYEDEKKKDGRKRVLVITLPKSDDIKLIYLKSPDSLNVLKTVSICAHNEG